MFRLLLAAALVLPCASQARETPRAAVERGVRFFHDHCSHHGAYVWRYSRDLTLSEGEAETDENTAWVQPPGTPTVGEAFLDAYDATGDTAFLRFAEEVGDALLAGRMQSGGWAYSISFDSETRRTLGYVGNTGFRPKKSGRDKSNLTTLDDDTTPAALRFLVRLDDRLKGSNPAVTATARYAADTIVLAQRANGGWPQNWTRRPVADREPPAPAASPPKTWSRKWLNDWPGQYYLNDDVAGQTIRTLLDAAEHFDEPRYLKAAVRGGLFLRAARLPEPQPGWAQQYDANMHPCWDRPFEPPAVSSHESEDAIRILIELADRTGRTEFLNGLERSIEYLRGLEVGPGRLARFYELGTDRPLYFTKDYQLTYDASDMPTHYAFIVDSELDDLSAELERVRAGRPRPRSVPTAGRVAEIVASLDERGAWVTPGNMKGFGKASREGVIESQTFVNNVRILSDYLKAAAP